MRSRDAQEEPSAIGCDHIDDVEVGIALVGPDGRFRKVNRPFSCMLGYEPEELEGRFFKDITYPEDRDLGDRERWLLAEGKIPAFSLRKRYLRKDGSPVGVRLIESLDRSTEEGELIKFIADISEQSRQDEELRGSRERYQRIMETSMEGIFTINPVGKLTFVNRRATELLGYTAEEMLGRSLFDFMDDESAARGRENLEKRKQGIKEHVDYRYLRRDGGIVWSITSLNPIFDYEGKFTGVLGMLIDISDRKVEEHLNRSLNIIANAISSTLDFDTILGKVINEAGKALDVEAASIILHEGGHWVVKSTYGPEELNLKMGQVYLAEQLPLVARVVGSRNIEVSKQPCADETDIWVNGRYEPGQYLLAPLIVRDELIGVIGFYSRCPYPMFDEHRIDFARKLSVSLSLATENVRLYQSESLQRALFQAIFDNAPMGIAVLDGGDLRVKYANDEFPKFFDEPPDSRKVVGKILLDVISRTDAAMISDVAAMVGVSGKPYVDREYEVIGNAGITYWSISAIPLVYRPGRPDILLLTNNVTGLVHARKKIEDLANKANSERARLRTILDTFPLGVIIVDSEGRMVESNAMRDSIWRGGASPSQKVETYHTMNAWWTETGKRVKPEEWPVELAYRTGELTLGVMIDIQRMDGGRATILNSAAPIKDQDGNIRGAVATIQDITPQRKVEAEAVQAKAEAELYVDLLGHDINNFIASAIGYLQLLEDRLNLEANDRAVLKKTVDALTNGANLISNVEKIRRLESREVAQHKVDVEPLLDDICRSYSSVGDVRSSVQCMARGHCTVLANELLKDVLINLVENAFKHSDRSVTVRIDVASIFEQGREQCKISVEDDGPGIPDDLKTKLFTRAQRGKTRASGRGLGLYLVRRFVENFDGRVWVEDRIPGDRTKGTRFVIILPRA